MIRNMRTLHPRGAAGPGICVDAEGAMLGSDHALVRRTSRGYRAIDRGDAAALQKCLFDATRDQDWLFRQCQRIADALNKGEVALAQIYGLRIPVDELAARRLAHVALAKAGFDPDEPRLPKGDPHGGEWTIEGTASATAENAEARTGESTSSPLPQVGTKPLNNTAPATVENTLRTWNESNNGGSTQSGPPVAICTRR